MAKTRKPRARRRERKFIPHGRAFVQSSFNNTHVTLTDQAGQVISWSSAGSLGFKGSRKGTAFAAQRAAEEAAKRGVDSGMRQVEVFVQGTGSGREAAIRSLQASGMVITSIRDVTPIPHNGCRASKRRRV